MSSLMTNQEIIDLAQEIAEEIDDEVRYEVAFDLAYDWAEEDAAGTARFVPPTDGEIEEIAANLTAPEDNERFIAEAAADIAADITADVVDEALGLSTPVPEITHALVVAKMVNVDGGHRFVLTCPCGNTRDATAAEARKILRKAGWSREAITEYLSDTPVLH